MSQDLVSIVATDEQVTKVVDLLAQIDGQLPGLISFPPDASKGQVFMGPRSENFCRQTVRVLTQNPQIVPPSLDLVGAQADLVAIDQLRPLLERVKRLQFP